MARTPETYAEMSERLDREVKMVHRWTIRFLWTGVIVGACILAANTIGCGVVESAGERVGVVTKLSRRGIINPTWEGEAIVGSVEVPGVGTNWSFTVSDDGPVEDVQAAMMSGRKVRIAYRELWNSGTYNGDTPYRVTEIKGADR